MDTIIEKYNQDIEEDKEVFNSIVQIAINDFAAGKENHDGIEEYYVPNMDFDAIEEVRNKIIERILSFAE